MQTTTKPAPPNAPGPTAEDIMQIHRIANRAHFLALKEDRFVSRNELATAVRTFHQERPLDLDAIEQAADLAFGREVFGIERYQEAAAKGLDNGFRSRFPKPATK